MNHRSMMPLSASLLLALLVATAPARAHKPSYSQGEHGTAVEAYTLEDLDTSIVVYHPVTCQTPQLWLAFDAPTARGIFLQLGVPDLDRLADYRPSLALLAPGLPQAPEGLPFDVPAGMGAVVIDTAAVAEPDVFYEPFTQSSSWVVHEQTHPLMGPGPGYVVAWHPEGRTGKLWVAVGTVEDFGPDDYDSFETWFVETQTFHEIDDYGPATEPAETVCGPPGPTGGASAPTLADDGAPDDHVHADDHAHPGDGALAADHGHAEGCAAGAHPGASPWGALLALMPVLGWRRARPVAVVS